MVREAVAALGCGRERDSLTGGSAETRPIWIAQDPGEGGWFPERPGS